MGLIRIAILWICSISFKRFRCFRIELNAELQTIEARLLRRYYEYEVLKKWKKSRRTK
jgi:hypothetical protein